MISSNRRSRAVLGALKREGSGSASPAQLAEHTRRVARLRGSASRRASARKAAETRRAATDRRAEGS